MSKRTGNIITVVLIAFIFIIPLVYMYRYATSEVTTRFYISELADGKYAYTENVASNIPANNYSITTVCREDGNIVTVHGEVGIIYDNPSKPYAVLTRTNMAKADRIVLHVPKNGVEYFGIKQCAR